MPIYADHTSMLRCAELHNVHVAKQLRVSSLCTRPLQPQGCQTPQGYQTPTGLSNTNSVQQATPLTHQHGRGECSSNLLQLL